MRLSDKAALKKPKGCEEKFVVANETETGAVTASQPLPSDRAKREVLPILSISSVSHAYVRQKVIDNISFGAPSGRVTMLLGPNGAGKTTLFSLITRLLALQHGKIFIDGQSIETAAAGEARKVGIVFQQPAIDLDLSVRQNLRYFGRLLGLATQERERRLEDELSRLGLADRAREKIRVLNGGHRRRVEIARALMAKPSLLLLDEPTVGLDPSTRRSLVSFLHGLAQDDGIGILWATHLVDEVWPEDQVIVMTRGKIAARGTPQQILAQAKRDDFGAAFEALTQEEAK
jgi:ABC-2 type transport system ATP-binding protein